MAGIYSNVYKRVFNSILVRIYRTFFFFFSISGHRVEIYGNERRKYPFQE